MKQLKLLVGIRQHPVPESFKRQVEKLRKFCNYPEPIYFVETPHFPNGDKDKLYIDTEFYVEVDNG